MSEKKVCKILHRRHFCQMLEKKFCTSRARYLFNENIIKIQLRYRSIGGIGVFCGNLLICIEIN